MEEPRSTTSRLPPLVWLIAVAHVALHLATNGRYGMFRDELYYLACADHLAWGYVDLPPFSVVVLKAVRAILGESVEAIRVVPALTGAALVLGTAALARAMGGGRAAQTLTALCVASSPHLLAITGIFNMDSLDHLFWLSIFLVFVRLRTTDDRRLWLLLGLLAGVGLLNKASVAFLGLGLAVVIPFTSLRRHLASPWPWAGALLAALVVLPHLLWQVEHDWPTREFIANATARKIASLSFGEYLGTFVAGAGPWNAPIWIAGLALLLFRAEFRPFRPLGAVFLVVLVFLAAQTTKPSYLTPALPPLVAAGAIGVESLARTRRRWIPWTVAAVVLAGALVAAPIAVPVLPVEQFASYQRMLGVRAPSGERGDDATLPQHLADRFGWREQAAVVEAAWSALPEDERPRCVIVTSNYGQAGGLLHFGRDRGLPPVACRHNSFSLWGLPPGALDVVITVGLSRRTLDAAFESVTPAGVVESPWARPAETGPIVFVCRGWKLPPEEAWRQWKRFI